MGFRQNTVHNTQHTMKNLFTKSYKHAVHTTRVLHPFSSFIGVLVFRCHLRMIFFHIQRKQMKTI